MDAVWNWAQTYYVVASIAGTIATIINVTLYFRSQPDRLAKKIDAVAKPIADRVAAVESSLIAIKVERDEERRSRDVAIKALDTDIGNRIRILSDTGAAQHSATTQILNQQALHIQRITTMLEHGAVTRQDIEGLHNRVTDVAKSCATTTGVVNGLQTSVENIENFLRDRDR